jgi:mannose-6-phosphate isomerase-like protein (cupin superfamily)
MSDETRRGRRVDKPWGHELIWAQTDRYVGKVLHIAAGEALSLQFHRTKDETMLLLSGSLEVALGDSEATLAVQVLAPGDRVHIWPGRLHRLTALSDCEVLEVSTPELDDVVRLADRYGRAGR